MGFCFNDSHVALDIDIQDFLGSHRRSFPEDIFQVCFNSLIRIELRGIA